jgi:hypothetical protein
MSYSAYNSLMPLPMIHPDIFKGAVHTQHQAQQVNSHIYSNTSAPSSTYYTSRSLRIGGGERTMVHCYFGEKTSSIIG